MKRSLICVIAVLLALPLHAAAATGVPEAAFHNDGRIGYFSVPVPLPLDTPVPVMLRAVVEEGGAYLVHVSNPTSPRPSGAPRPGGPDGALTVTVAGRYSDAGKNVIAIFALPLLDLTASPRKVARITVTTPSGVLESPQVKKTWGELQYRRFQKASLGGRDPFQDYWELTAAAGHDVKTRSRTRSRRPGQPPPNLYSVFTGAAAIQESLQLEVLGQGAGAAGGRPAEEPSRPDKAVPLEELAGPQVASHPFGEMLAGRSPEISPLARFVPSDQYFFLFDDINRYIEFTDLATEWGGNLLREIQTSARDFHLREKMGRQVALDTSLLTRLFGDRVIGSMAFSGRDPFFKEGTEFTILFELKDEQRFRAHLEKRHKEAGKKNGAGLATIRIGGKEVLTAVTPDRRVSSYAVFLDGYAAVANSKGALERIIETAGGGLTPLAAAEDFLYMRTIFERGAGEEDIFLYLSDAHIRQLIGPRWKIGEARRMRCAGVLQVLANARLWFRAERRSEPTVEDLHREGYLGEADITCPHGGEYFFDGSGAPRCSVHNRLGHLTPVGDIPLAEVTAEEAQLYNNFVTSYSRYWRRFFDPIGIRVSLGRDIRIETFILPLIENSWYDGLVALAGPGEGSLTEASLLPETIFSLRARLSPEWLGVARASERAWRNLPISWVGEEASLNVADGEVFFHFGEGGNGMLAGLGRGRRGPSFESLFIGYLVAAVNLPTYLSIEVREPERFEQALPTLFRSLFPKERSRDFAVETYALADYKGRSVYAASFNVFVIKWRLFLSVVEDRLIVASRSGIIERLIDEADKSDVPPPSAAGSMEMSLYRDAYRKLAPGVSLGFQEGLREACLRNLALSDILLAAVGVEAAKLQEAAFALRGYRPYCPSGGTYGLDEKSGLAACSIHGTAFSPRQPLPDRESSPTLKLVRSLKRVNARLSFIPEGLMTIVEIERREN